VKQEDVASFAYKVEMLRKTLATNVAGVFFTKTGHQRGAVRVGQFNGIDLAILREASRPPSFNLTFLRYDSSREQKLRHMDLYVGRGSLTFCGSAPKVTQVKRSDGSEAE
jgi:hypothetical protein